jgi:hypothetical protein
VSISPQATSPEGAAQRAKAAGARRDGTGTWRTQIAHRRDAGSSRGVGNLGRLWRRVEPLVVVAVAAVVVGIILRAAYYHVYQAQLTGFLNVGQDFAQRAGLPGLASSPYGYDGQFYYFLALRPQYFLSCVHPTLACPIDAPVYRMQRVLFPMTAKILSLGNPSLLPLAFLEINVVSILVCVAVAGQWFAEAGLSRWLGLAAGLCCGQLIGLLRDVPDPYGVMWFVLTLYLLQRRRVVLAALCGAAALLTREQFLLFLPLLALPWIFERRWGLLAQSALITFGPFIVWQLVLHALYGQWPLTQSSKSAPLVPVPFSALWQLRHSNQFVLLATCVAVPIVAVAALSILALWRDGPAVFTLDPLPLVVVAYCLLISVTGVINWADVWAAARLAAPAMVVGLLVARKALPSQAASLATLLVMSCVAPIILAW